MALSSLDLFPSLLLLASSLEAQKSLLDLGTLPCIGQECQKQPWTKTTSLSRGKTKSGQEQPEGVLILRCLRHPETPMRLMARDKGTSVVPFPLDRILDIMRERVAESTVSISPILSEKSSKARRVSRGASRRGVPDHGGG